MTGTRIDKKRAGVNPVCSMTNPPIFNRHAICLYLVGNYFFGLETNTLSLFDKSKKTKRKVHAAAKIILRKNSRTKLIMTITLSTKKPSFWTMILSLTLFTAAGTVSGFTVGGNELTQTRILGRSSTKSYVSSVPLSVRNRSQMDGNTSSEGRWFSRPKQGEVQNSNQESLVVSADEHAVDDYLEFLDRRYR